MAEPAKEVQKPEQSLVSQYEEETPTTSPEATPPAPVAESTPRPTPPKDPETGRFIPAPPAESQQHNPRLVAWARDLGMTDDDLHDIPADHLEHVLHTLNRQTLARQREGSVERALTGQPAGADTSAPLQEQPLDWGKGEDGAQLTEADFNPTIVRMFKSLHTEIRELKGHINSLHQRDVARQNETMAQRLDRKFAEYETILGKGTVNDFAEGSVELARRRAVLSLVENDKAKGSLEAKIDKAVRMLYGKRAETPKPSNGVQAKSRISEEEWAQAGLARPTARTVDPEPPGEKKAIASVARALREIEEAGPTEKGSGQADTEDFI